MLQRSESGQGLIEYGLVLVIVSVAVIIILLVLGSGVENLLRNVVVNI